MIDLGPILEVLVDDPRRLAAVVGDAPAAQEVAHALARALDPGPRPCVVLERPVHDAAELRRLLSEPLHPRLLVLVPCSRGVAARLPALAGGYPRASMLVLAVGDGGALDAPPVRPERGREAPDHRTLASHRLALGDPAGAALALEHAAELTRDRLEHLEAAALLEQALALWRRIGEHAAAARCHLRLGHFADRRADPRAAIPHYEAALAGYRAIGVAPGALERVLDDLRAARAAAAGMGDGTPVAVDVS